MSETANLSLPFIAAAQAQKHVTHNEALLKLDALVQLAVLTRGFSSPPADPEEGARYLIATPASDDWSGHENAIAAFQDGAWNIFAPEQGWRLWIADEEKLLVFANGGWTSLDREITQTSRLGISAGADDYNRLVVAGPASLFTHSGGGHQLKLNKAEPGETASLLFQTNWSGRAEMGLAGDDRFRIKVSADGGSWREALTVDGTSGRVSFPAGIGLGGTQIRLAPASSFRLTGLADGEPSRLIVLTNETAGGEGALILLEHRLARCGGDRSLRLRQFDAAPPDARRFDSTSLRCRSLGLERVWQPALRARLRCLLRCLRAERPCPPGFGCGRRRIRPVIGS